MIISQEKVLRLVTAGLFIFALAACSSSNKKESQEVQEAPLAAFEPPPSQLEPAATIHEVKTEPKTEVKKATTSNPYLGLSEAIRSNNDEAIFRSASGVLAQTPNDIKAQNAMGLYHYRKGRFLAAQYFFFKAIKNNPNSSDLYNSLGLSWLGLNEEKEAIAAFKKAVELDSSNSTPALNLSSIYIAHKDYARAVVPLEMAIKKGAKDYKVLNNYGIALAATGKHSQAKDQYQAALSVNSSAKDVMLNLAILQIDHLKNYQEGLDLVSKLKFLGVPEGARSRINSLENIAKAGLK